jgi:PadR family transcriptional regulator, regulatory protein PadR
MIHILHMHHAHHRKPSTQVKLFSAGLFRPHLLLRRKRSAPGALMAQMRKGTTAWIVLAVLEEGAELYGYGLRREVFEKSKGSLSIEEGPLYPLLARMQRTQWIMSRRQTVSGRDRRYYRITIRGRQALAEYRHEWKRLCSVLGTLGCFHA